jgi:hypothetical protein
MDVGKPKSGTTSAVNSVISLIDYRKTAAILVAVVVAGVLLMEDK